MASVLRPQWIARIESAWRVAPIVWLAGVRRVGKTTLGRSLEDATLFNCDLPSVADRLADPELFFQNAPTKRIVLDEIHQLSDPSRVLKIAADEFPKLRILATGSSTLAATSKFRDTLTGRKRNVHLLPVLATELSDFGADLEKRLFQGGLPPFLLAPKRDPEAYSEWLDSYFARDVQELFRVEKRAGFLRLFALLLRQSGGLAEATKLAGASGLSRPTVMNYLNVLEVTQAIHVLRPFHGGSKQEILSQPKIYAFDTGFVAWSRGWDSLRREDMGILWEHVVLDSLLTLPKLGPVQFWRDKKQRELDFIIPRGRDRQDAIECKWSVSLLESKAFVAFRTLHPRGRNFLAVPTVDHPYPKRLGDLEVTVISPAHFTSVFG